jgi:xanthine dehydrogenase accessory factor
MRRHYSLPCFVDCLILLDFCLIANRGRFLPATRPFRGCQSTRAWVIVARMSSTAHILEQSACAASEHSRVLALVVDTEGSTYVRAGGMALFAPQQQWGWLSGGCLEPEIAERAAAADRDGQLAWMDIDTRDDEDLFSGSALGCRGRLHIALIPLRLLPGWPELVQAWRRRQGALVLRLHADGALSASVGEHARHWRLPTAPPPWSATAPMQVSIAAPPAVAVFGGGPETPALLPLLRQSGWIAHLIERRPRWLPMREAADDATEAAPAAAAKMLADGQFDAALVMHHHFELDREALAMLADTAIPFIGLLGPRRRREDLFRLLPPSAHAQLLPRLRSPVGLDLGGQGPEAIALSIAAQLQAWRHGRQG